MSNPLKVERVFKIVNDSLTNIRQKQFRFNSRKIEKCKFELGNLSKVDFDVTVVSQLHHSAIYMGVMALVSFIESIGLKVKLELLDDGSLTEKDKALLNRTFDNPNLTHINKINLEGCPSGGTWERLCHILELCANSYVVQVDSDTFSSGGLKQVRENILHNKAFTIVGEHWQKPISPVEMSNLARSWNGEHVQVMAESLFDQLRSIKMNKYIRGCSAFAGFPKGCNLRESLSSFSHEMESNLGENKWRQWGSEQLSSNVMISLCDPSEALPWPEYQNFGFPWIKGFNQSSYELIHFIGSNRYAKGVYSRRLKQFLATHQVGLK
jgi:hypothetical protein